MSSYMQQLEQWVLGNSTHDTVLDQCCPDFSCCNNRSGWDIAARQRFHRAVVENDNATKYEMLGMALASLINDTSPAEQVYIAGLQNPDAVAN